MGELKVFSSEGAALHPKDAENDRKMTSYFDARVLSMRASAEDNLGIEIYLRIERQNRPEQVSLRYLGDDPTTFFEDCRAAIKKELEQKRGWKILSPSGNRDPTSVFWHGIWERSTTPSPTFFEDIQFGLDPDEVALLQSHMADSGTKPIRVEINRYETIGRRLPQLLETGYFIAVSRPKQAPEGDVDIQFLPKKGQRENFKLDQEAYNIINQKKKEKIARERSKKLEQLNEVLKDLERLDTDQRKVHSSLSDSLNSHFPELIVESKSNINELKKKAKSSSQSNQTSRIVKERDHPAGPGSRRVPSQDNGINVTAPQSKGSSSQNSQASRNRQLKAIAFVVIFVISIALIVGGLIFFGVITLGFTDRFPLFLF